MPDYQTLCANSYLANVCDDHMSLALAILVAADAYADDHDRMMVGRLDIDRAEYGIPSIDA